jgi:hypothetical protein
MTLLKCPLPEGSLTPCPAQRPVAPPLHLCLPCACVCWGRSCWLSTHLSPPLGQALYGIFELKGLSESLCSRLRSQVSTPSCTYTLALVSLRLLPHRGGRVSCPTSKGWAHHPKGAEEALVWLDWPSESLLCHVQDIPGCSLSPRRG